jgi:hypothetical protein
VLPTRLHPLRALPHALLDVSDHHVRSGLSNGPSLLFRYLCLLSPSPEVSHSVVVSVRTPGSELLFLLETQTALLNVRLVPRPRISRIALLLVTTATAQPSLSAQHSGQVLGNVLRHAVPTPSSLAVLLPRHSPLAEARSLLARQKSRPSSLLSTDRSPLYQPLLQHLSLVQPPMLPAGTTRDVTTANSTSSTRFSQDSRTLSRLTLRLLWTATHVSLLARSKMPPTCTQSPWAPLVTALPRLHPPIHWRRTSQAATSPVRAPRQRGVVAREPLARPTSSEPCTARSHRYVPFFLSFAQCSMLNAL